MGSEPRGTIRLHVASAAETYLTGTLLAGFLVQNPHVNLDLVLGDESVDIVAEGYDAGVRLGEVIDGDMIAEPISGDLRLLVLGAPSYFARRSKPLYPRDLADHECINWHATAAAKPYRWEFTENGREFSVAVPARVLATDPVLNVRIALAGVGLTLATEDRVRAEVASGKLVPVLEEFSMPFPGFYLYYPQLRRASQSLRALVAYLRALREPKRR